MTFKSKDDELDYILNSLGHVPILVYFEMADEWVRSNGKFLKESINKEILEQVESLNEFSASNPTVGEKYIPVLIQLFGDRLVIMDVDGKFPPTQPARFIELEKIDENYVQFKGKSEWPLDRLTPLSIMKCIIVDSVSSYDELRFAIEISFGIDMPPVDKNSLKESNRTAKLLNICNEILSDNNTSDNQKFHATETLKRIKEQLHPSGIKERTSDMKDSKQTFTEGEKVKTKKGMVHKGSYGTEYEGDGPKKPTDKSTTGKRGRPAKQDEVKPEYSKMNDLFGRSPDKAPAGKAGRKVKGAGTIDDDLEDISEDTAERPYVAVHAKKGKTEVTATSSYDAAKKAAAKWKLKGTAGIDVHLADVKKIATEAKKSKAPKNPYAIGMAQAEKETGDTPPLKKSTITKAHKIAKEIEKKSDKKAKTVKESLAHTRELKKRISETIVSVQSLTMDQQNDPRIAAMVTKLEESVGALFETQETLDHIAKRFPAEVKSFAHGDELDSHLYDALYDYYHLHGEMPYGIAKGREGDPYQWVSDRFDQDVRQYVTVEPEEDEDMDDFGTHHDAQNWDELDEAADQKKVWWTSSSGLIELQIDLDDAMGASHPGDNEMAVRELMAKPYMKQQLAKLSPIGVSKELKEYGAWDDQELADPEMNLVRLVWCAAHDINGEDEHDFVNQGVAEGMVATMKKFGKKAIDTLGHGSDEEMIKDLQKKAGVPVTGKKPEQEVDETAYGPDEKQADLTKIKTRELRQLQALHKRYEDNPRNKESAKQGAEELKNRGITVAESNDTLSRIQQLSGIKK
jgi:hypothetical protein